MGNLIDQHIRTNALVASPVHFVYQGGKSTVNAFNSKNEIEALKTKEIARKVLMDSKAAFDNVAYG